MALPALTHPTWPASCEPGHDGGNTKHPCCRVQGEVPP